MAKIHARGRKELFKMERIQKTKDEHYEKNFQEIYAFMSDGNVLGKRNLKGVELATNRTFNYPGHWTVVNWKKGFNNIEEFKSALLKVGYQIV